MSSCAALLLVQEGALSCLSGVLQVTKDRTAEATSVEAGHAVRCHHVVAVPDLVHNLPTRGPHTRRLRLPRERTREGAHGTVFRKAGTRSRATGSRRERPRLVRSQRYAGPTQIILPRACIGVIAAATKSPPPPPRRTGSTPRHSKEATGCHSPPSATYSPAAPAATAPLDGGASETSLIRAQPLHRTYGAESGERRSAGRVVVILRTMSRRVVRAVVRASCCCSDFVVPPLHVIISRWILSEEQAVFESPEC